MSHGKNPASVQLREHAYDAAAMFVVACSSPLLSVEMFGVRVNGNTKSTLTRDSRLSSWIDLENYALTNAAKPVIESYRRSFPELTSPRRRTGSRYKKARRTVLYRGRRLSLNDDARRSPDYDTERSWRDGLVISCLCAYVPAL